MAGTPPPPPAIANHILIGLNSVTRHLEALAAKTAPSTTLVASTARESTNSSTDTNEQEKATARAGDDLRPLSMVILTHPKPSLSPAHAHLPTLVHLCTLSPPSTTPNAATATRLVPLPTSAEGQLASSLHIPRVGALAIYADAPGAKTLEDYVRKHIGMTECKWIEEALSAEWRGMKVSIEMPRAK
jgi:ribonuclease P/MRP protein subunit POP3